MMTQQELRTLVGDSTYNMIFQEGHSVGFWEGYDTAKQKYDAEHDSNSYLDFDREPNK